MDRVTPPLVGAIQSLRWMISAGRAPKDAVRTYLDENADELAHGYRELWVWRSRGLARPAAVPKVVRGVYRRTLWDLIERGLAGEPILNALAALEDEVDRAARAELDLHLAALPFKLLIPLLMFQFPAYLLLLLGPALNELTRSLGSA